VDEDLAIETMPNVGHVTLGGILGNAVHGTNGSIGTFGDQVEEIEIVIASGEVLTLNRHDKDPRNRHLFDACLISFGTLGIMYSLTVRLVPSYAVLKVCHVIPMEESIRNVVKYAHENPDGVQYIIHQPASWCFLFTKHNMPISAAGSLMYKERDVMFQMQLSLSYWLYGFPIVMDIVALYFPFVKDMKIFRWDRAEVYPNHQHRFINMEYGLPESTIVETLEEVISIIRKDPERSPVTGIVVRVVGKDSRGYLSPTNTSSPFIYYIDIPYREKSDKEREFFGELEELFLRKGGRVSMARWFVKPNKELFRNVENFDKFLEAKRELDPNDIFGNELTDLFLH
jgi:FAD/FMN-containing dehydrogenase